MRRPASEIGLLRLQVEGARISAAFSPDGTRIVTAVSGASARDAGNNVRVWDAASGREIAVMRYRADATSAAFSPDGTRIITMEDATTPSGSGTPGTAGRSPSCASPAMYAAAFSPDGTRVATSRKVWDVTFAMMSTKDLVAEACLRRLRGITTLTRDEMRLAGYPDGTPEFDVCAGVQIQ